MEAPAAISRAERNRPWLAELRATLTLAWPLILANLTQQAIQATDVLLMGRLGPTQLAAATLALNLTFTFNLFMLGLITASSPMMATALGQRSNAVRDVRRTFRAGLWLLAFFLPPYWLVLWHIGALMQAFGESAELARQGQSFMRTYMWSTAGWLVFQLLRNFVSALERPRVVLWLSLAGIALNALLSWSLIFGHLGLPALGLPGGGLGSSLTWLIICGALILITIRERHCAHERHAQDPGRPTCARDARLVIAAERQADTDGHRLAQAERNHEGKRRHLQRDGMRGDGGRADPAHEVSRERENAHFERHSQADGPAEPHHRFGALRVEPPEIPE